MPEKIPHVSPRRFLESCVDESLKNGPLVFEAWRCVKCYVDAWAVHRFDEVISCGNCGHRHASAVPLYRFAVNEAAESK